MLMIEQKEAWQIRYVYILSLSSGNFLDITCKSIISDNDCTELSVLLMLMFARTVDFLCVYWSIPSTFFGAFT